MFPCWRKYSTLIVTSWEARHLVRFAAPGADDDVHVWMQLSRQLPGLRLMNLQDGSRSHDSVLQANSASVRSFRDYGFSMKV